MIGDFLKEGFKICEEAEIAGMSLAGMPPNARGLDMAAGALPIQPEMMMRAQPAPAMAYTNKPQPSHRFG